MEDSRIRVAVDLAERYGGIGSEHHKQWVIDQMLRALLGEQYDAWVAAYNQVDGYDAWDTGIAP